MVKNKTPNCSDVSTPVSKPPKLPKNKPPVSKPPKNKPQISNTKSLLDKIILDEDTEDEDTEDTVLADESIGEMYICGSNALELQHQFQSSLSEEPTLNLVVTARDIGGILYYICENNMVYDPEDILAGKPNPVIIGVYTGNNITNTQTQKHDGQTPDLCIRFVPENFITNHT